LRQLAVLFTVFITFWDFFLPISGFAGFFHSLQD